MCTNRACMHLTKPNQAKTTACTVFRQRHLAVKGLGLTKNETHMQHTGFHLVLVSSAITKICGPFSSWQGGVWAWVSVIFSAFIHKLKLVLEVSLTFLWGNACDGRKQPWEEGGDSIDAHLISLVSLYLSLPFPSALSFSLSPSRHLHSCSHLAIPSLSCVSGEVVT